MKLSIVCAAVSAVLAAMPAWSQEGAAPRVQVVLLEAGNLAHEGWGTARAFSWTGVRAAVGVAGGLNVWSGVSRANTEQYACVEPRVIEPTQLDPQSSCEAGGTPVSVQGGLGYRFAGAELDRVAPFLRGRVPGRLVPFVGAGVASTERVGAEGRSLRPHLHGGLDWAPVPYAALRLEAQSEGQTPARVALGAAFMLP